MHPDCRENGCTADVACGDGCVRAQQDAPADLGGARFERRLAEFTQRTWGAGHGPGEDIRADSDGLQSLARAGAHPLRLAEQTIGGCINALMALEEAVPAETMGAEAIPLINACGTVLSLCRSELDTILKAQALAYAASEAPDAA